MKPTLPRVRTPFLLLLLVAASLTSGCVYLRLLQFKNQLADFEKHFSTDLSDGFRVNFKDPVLLGEDLRWLGAEPETIRRTPPAEQWTIRWEKEVPPGTQESGVYDVEIQADLRERRLRSLYIPERYFAFVSKDLFLNALRSAGHAKIDRQNRQAVLDTSTETDTTPPPVNLSSIEKMLGVPTQLTRDATTTSYRYVFRPKVPSGGGKAIEVTFLFDLNSGNLHRLVGKLPRGTLNFEFADPAVPKK